MKSQLDLHVAVLEDQARLLAIPSYRDVATLTTHVAFRGEGFLTQELPNAGKFLETGLDSGDLDHARPAAFGRKSNHDQRPEFLFGFWSLIFTPDGFLMEHPSWEAVRALRQIFYLHSKLKELPTPDKVDAALHAFVQTDENISNTTPEDQDLRVEFKAAVRKMFGSYFDRMEARLYRDSFLDGSCHGPGAVAQKLTSNGKWDNLQWSERLQSLFPAYEYLTSGGLTTRAIEMLSPGNEHPARVTCVPKTAKSPRVISIEPTYNQFIQHGLSAMFEQWMDLHPVVGYTSQEPNRRLAKRGSETGSYATIDLSEASDRVSLGVVKLMLNQHPLLLQAVLACRSLTAVLPDGSQILLKKYASMGSALTFPIEGLVFASICGMVMMRHSMWKGRLLKGDFRVYGDDIIVPTDVANECIDSLEAFGLKVNQNKSFVNAEGRFRESCGGDYFLGKRVVPVRARKRLPCTRSDVDEVVAIVAFRNLYFEEYGYTEFVTKLDDWIGEIIPFPFGYPTTPGLVRWGYEINPDGTDPRLHRPYVMGVRPVYNYRFDPLDGTGALLKYFWTPFNEDPKHLQRAGRPVSAKLKYGKILL